MLQFNAKCFPKCSIYPTKMWQKTDKTFCFVTILTHFENHFCLILNTFLYFVRFCIHFCTIFDTNLLHFGFWQFFDSLLTVICHILVFWHIFVSFLIHYCHIFEMSGPTLNKSTEKFTSLEKLTSRKIWLPGKKLTSRKFYFLGKLAYQNKVDFPGNLTCNISEKFQKLTGETLALQVPKEHFLLVLVQLSTTHLCLGSRTPAPPPWGPSSASSATPSARLGGRRLRCRRSSWASPAFLARSLDPGDFIRFSAGVS